MDKNLGLAMLTFEVAANATEMQILPAHDFRADDGRPEDVDSWKINSSIAQKLIEKLASRKNDLLIDYEHQSLRTSLNGQPVIAAGWFKHMEWRDGSGMWLKQVGLTNKAKAHINEKELRYTSPVFAYDKKTGEILEIISVALTNTPAVDGMKEITALSASYIKNHYNVGEDMSGQDIAVLTKQLADLNTQLVVANQERDQKKAQVVQLTTDLKTANDQLAALTAQIATEKAAAEKKAHSDLLQTALSDGRLAPKQKEWAAKQSLAELTAFLETAPVILDGKLQHDQLNQGGDQLTAEELAMCTNMQIDPQAFLATKTAK